ncbi:phosphoglycerate mutase [Actinoplanes sp. SE50]|uniref:histidine phosphatase family protein n=1 Tax=unclassified Actinoplanes TaxID=2626549 RepID=UPI00023EBCB6|nr:MULTISPECIES: histidine phosphatase family protein [unclassified Actinoplanes]AEV82319.1 Phosphoglycerate mutase family member 5 [Actinoplanes sp. SE50/110]ATO80716.1 phosphoglycerate mutase [Actinoplanes sp. SE50]SLL98123.1 phosphoglycerate mutase [Actinoplanes sp. SE50/110]
MRHLWIARHAFANEDETGLTGDGEQQAALLGKRLADVPLTAVHHSPLARAVQTATIVAAHLPPEVPLHPADELDDQFPTPANSAGMIARFTGAAPVETHELVITHAFQVAWFVRDALEAPEDRWRGLNSCNAGLTLIRYFPGQKPRVIMFNDVSHLPASLQWTGFPPELRP